HSNLFITLLLPISWTSYRPKLPPSPCDPHRQVYSWFRTSISPPWVAGPSLKMCPDSGTLSLSTSINWSLLHNSNLPSKLTFLRWLTHSESTISM
ncbi:hypothetical protein LDENG_00180300, partial [Lucifuga dentata]